LVRTKSGRALANATASAQRAAGAAVSPAASARSQGAPILTSGSQYNPLIRAFSTGSDRPAVFNTELLNDGPHRRDAAALVHRPRGFARKQRKKDMQIGPKMMNFLFRRARLAISRGRIGAGRLSAVCACSEAKDQVE
jgi:hypothetical protein